MENSTSLIITGASPGIGRAVALRLAQPPRAGYGQGWDGCLVLTGRSRKRLKETKAQVEAVGGAAMVIACDLTQPTAMEELVTFAEAQAPLYGVVMSAGSASYGPVAEHSPADWRRTLEINLLAPYQLSRSALARMAPRKQGHLIFINSVAGLKSFAGSSAYVAAKHGLRGFTETLRQEAREQGVKVSSIFPGATDTEWWDQLGDDVPRHRMLRPEDVAAAVDFVLSFSELGVVEELVVRHLSGDF